MLLAHRSVVPNLRLLAVLNVRHVAAAYPIAAEGLSLAIEADGVSIHEIEPVLPRAFVVRRVIPTHDLPGALAWLASNDPRQAATADHDVALSGPIGISDAELLEYTPNRIVVQADGPGMLVVSEVYDPDWRAQVDGHEVPLVRADGVLRGVFLEAGGHTVSLSYHPAGLRFGAGVTGLAWIVTVLLWIAAARSSKKASIVRRSVLYSEDGRWAG
jgi:hypothetical protein